MKHKLHKLMALILATALLCCLLPLGATAEEVQAKDLMRLVGTSRAEVHAKASDDSRVVALAFRFRVDAPGLALGAGRKTIYDDATVTFGGSTYALTDMGAVMCNKAAIGNNPNAFVVGTSSVKDIPAAYLFGAGKDYGEFVARIVNVPVEQIDTLIYARPYFVYKDDAGEEVIVYGNIDSANASGKKVRYAVETGDLAWTAGTLDPATGIERESAKEIRTAFINSTDLLVRLPADDKGTPIAYVRAYYYSAEGFLSAVDVKENWAVLSDLGVPEEAVAVRLVAYAADGSTIADSKALGDSILVTANKKLGAIPLSFQSGGLSAEDGRELSSAEQTRTGYLAVQDVLIKPESGSRFTACYYAADKTFIAADEIFMTKAKRLLNIAPEEAAYVRFVLEREEEIPEEDEEEDLDEPEMVSNLPTEVRLVPECVAYFRVYVKSSVQYNDFAYEADEEEWESTDATTEATTDATTEASTDPITSATGETDPTATTKPTSKPTSKPSTTKKPTTKPSSLILTEDKPENQGVQNALWNMEQMVNITYTPIKAIPQNLSTWPANVQQKGLPYSSTKIEQAYVPQNISFHTFMTALKNPKSYLYTVDLGDYNNKNGRTYYGAVCSTACGYALNIDANYTSYQWSIIPGMELVKGQDLQNLKLGDTIAGQGHVLMITGITRDQTGRIVKFKISQAAGSDVHSTTYTISAMEDAYPASKYEYCRYSQIKNVTYTASEYVAVGKETAQKVSYNTTIIPRKGDKANWRSEETVVLDVLNKGSYTDVEIYKSSSTGWNKVSTKEIATTIKLSGQKPGTYKARLTNGSKTSKWCYWIVTDVESEGKHYQGTRRVKVTFSATNAKPLYVQWMNGHTNATVRITNLTADQIKDGYGIFTPAKGDLKVRVAFETAYGIIYSELPEIITVQ